MHLAKTEVVIKTSHPDPRLHNYVGDIIESRNHEVLVEFKVKIRNEIDRAWVNLRDIRAV